MNTKAHGDQKGFTLIELIVVIVILGVLAATALPKFINVKDDAEAAAIQGVAGGVAAAFATNYAGRMANDTKGVAIAGAGVDVNAAAGSIMLGGMPAGFTVTAAAATVNCTVAGQEHAVTISNSNHNLAENKTAAATLICTG